MPVSIDVRHENGGALKRDQGGFSYVGRFLGGFESKPQKDGLNEKRKELQYCDDSQNQGVMRKIAIELNELPIKLRLFFSFLALACSLFLAFGGGYHLDGERRLLGPALIGGGCLLGLLELGLAFRRLLGLPGMSL